MDASASLYDDDFLAWTEQQALAVRALAGRPDLTNALDWDNLVEEIETLGRSLVSSVERKLTLTLVHLLKRLSAPDSPPGRLWAAEATAFQVAARKNFTPSMRRRIDIDELWTDAWREAGASLGAYGDPLVGGLPSRCPFGLDDLVSREFDVEAALATLARSLHEARRAG